MNKYLLFLSITGWSLFAGAQTVADSTLVDQNFERLSDLKLKLKQVGKSIEEQEKMEVSNLEILQLLQGLDEKISRIRIRQDSLILVLGATQKVEHLEGNAEIFDRYYLVIESHKSPERAAIALTKRIDTLHEAMEIRLSESGRWHYVIMSDGVMKNELQNKLATIRKTIPSAWYISESKLMD